MASTFWSMLLCSIKGIVGLPLSLLSTAMYFIYFVSVHTALLEPLLMISCFYGVSIKLLLIHHEFPNKILGNTSQLTRKQQLGN